MLIIIINPWALIWLMLLSCLLVFAGGMGIIALSIRKRRRLFDSAFIPLGLAGQPYQINYRQYHGIVHGRQVDIYINPGPSLDLYISTPLRTRLDVALQHETALSQGKRPLFPLPPELSGLVVCSMEDPWAHTLFAHARAPELIWRMTAPSWSLTSPKIIFKPGLLNLSYSANSNLFRYGIAPEQARQWINDAMALLYIAESLPPPRIFAEETSAERSARSRLRSNHSLARDLFELFRHRYGDEIRPDVQARKMIAALLFTSLLFLVVIVATIVLWAISQ